MDQPIALSDRMLASLNATRPWVKFIAIVWFVGIAFMVIFGLAMITGIYTGFSMPGFPALLGRVFGTFYIVIALVYVAPALYLYRYAKAIAGVQGSAVMASFEGALKQQKSFWKFYGIFIIVVIVLCLLLFVGSMIVGLYVATHHH
ncbi:MAG: hypothetical protein ACYDCJ_03950 [Gammaproteobacteria bacterium]